MDILNYISHSFTINLLQITFSLLFSIVIAFMSDALGSAPDKEPVLSEDAVFRSQFHELVSTLSIAPLRYVFFC